MRTPPVRRILVVLAVALATAACAGENARTVALTTLKAVAQYEKELDRKIKAEKTFYKKQSETLRIALAGVAPKPEPSQDAQADAAPDPESGKVLDDAEIKKTWLYGRLRTATAMDTRRTAGEIFSTHDGRSLSLIMDYVARGIDGSQKAIADVRAKQAELARNVSKNLQPIDKQKKRLAALRKGLTTLAAEPSSKARFEQVKAIAAIVAREIEKGDSGN